ncbi:MAG TPA: cytochrome c [Bacteroidia bacterium]|nr:cytochrome c [Bacteroidia bacterium]
MKSYKILLASCSLLMVISCGGNKEETKDTSAETKDIKSMYPDQTAATDAKGVGKFKDITLPATLDSKKADAGQAIYDMKCSACHRLEGDRLVGPTWKGVTTRREPAWILNFITNVDEMLNKDPMAMAQLEECLVRMPNQNLTDDDAYAILEYMRKNDGVK